MIIFFTITCLIFKKLLVSIIIEQAGIAQW